MTKPLIAAMLALVAMPPWTALASEKPQAPVLTASLSRTDIRASEDVWLQLRIMNDADVPARCAPLLLGAGGFDVVIFRDAMEVMRLSLGSLSCSPPTPRPEALEQGESLAVRLRVSGGYFSTPGPYRIVVEHAGCALEGEPASTTSEFGLRVLPATAEDRQALELIDAWTLEQRSLRERARPMSELVAELRGECPGSVHTTKFTVQEALNAAGQASENPEIAERALATLEGLLDGDAAAADRREDILEALVVLSRGELQRAKATAWEAELHQKYPFHAPPHHVLRTPSAGGPALP